MNEYEEQHHPLKENIIINNNENIENKLSVEYGYIDVVHDHNHIGSDDSKQTKRRNRNQHTIHKSFHQLIN